MRKGQNKILTKISNTASAIVLYQDILALQVTVCNAWLTCPTNKHYYKLHKKATADNHQNLKYNNPNYPIKTSFRNASILSDQLKLQDLAKKSKPNWMPPTRNGPAPVATQEDYDFYYYHYY